MIKRQIALLTLAVFAPGLRADEAVLWDNGIEPDLVTGTIVATPKLPDVRIVDEFIVPEGSVWILTGFRLWNPVGRYAG